MAERYVRMNILSSGGEKAKATLDDLAARARALEAESPDLKITADDTAATRKIKDLQLKIQILNRERAEVAFEAKGDEKVKAQLLDIKAKLKDLSEHTADPKVNLRDADKTEASLIRIKLLMDSIHNKRVDVKIAEGNSESLLARLGRSANKSILGIPKGANGEGEGGSGLAGLLNGSPGEFLTNPLVGGPLGSLLAGLIPSVAGFGVGGLVGAGGVGLSALIASQSATTIKSDQTIIAQLQKDLTNKKTPKGDIPLVKSNLAEANKQLSSDVKTTAPFVNLIADAKNLLTPLAGILAPFARALDPMIIQLGKFEQLIGPQMSKMFMASLPFLKSFITFMEEGGKALIPAFTQAMNTMVKSGALKEMTQALVLLITDGLVPFLRILGPGMKASSELFKAVILILDGLLIGIAALSTYVAREFVMLGHAVIDMGKIFYDIGRVIGALITGNWKAMGNAIASLGNNFRNFFATLANMLDAGFANLSKFGKNTVHVFDGIRHDVSAIWDDTWNAVAGAFRSFYNDDQHMMDNLRHSIANIFDGIRHDVASIWDSAWRDVSNRFYQNSQAILSGIRGWNHAITDNFDNLRHSVASIWDSMWREVKNLTSSGVRGVSNAIHGIESAFRTPVAWVVDNVWDRLAGIWNKITGIVHLSSLKLPTVHMAEGGIVPGSGKGDHVPAMLEPGERILSNSQVASVGGHGVLDMIFGRGTGGPLGYSGGGIIGGIGGFLKNIGKDLVGWASKPLSFITEHLFGSVTSMLGGIPGASPGMDDVLKSLTVDLINNLGKQAKSGAGAVLGGKYTGHYGAGVAQWRGDVLKALSMEHLPAFLAGRVLYQMQTESGGNPNAINLTDSNAAAGDPSRGLLQTIATTFRAYHWPGTSWDIYNPLANIAAAINYARHTYGPDLMRDGMGMGSGHGYANGGWITEPIIGTGLRSGHAYSFGENGFEYVSPGGRRGNSSGGDNYYISVMGDTDPDGAALRIHQKLRAYKKRKGNVPLGLD